MSIHRFLLFLGMIGVGLAALGQGGLGTGSSIALDTFRLEASKSYRHTKIISESVQTLAQELQSSSPVFLKDYGVGNLATLTYQGTSASQTSLYWEGINLNPTNSGVTDYSLVDSYLFDEYQLETSQNTRAGSGIGADLTLLNSVATDTGVGVGGMMSFGVFNDLNAGFKTSYLDAKNSLKLSLLVSHEVNDYRFFDPDKARFDRRINNQKESVAGLFSYHRFLKKGVVYLKSWNKTSHREIPSPITVMNQNETQSDQFSRNTLGLAQDLGNRSELKVSVSKLWDNYRYQNPTSGIRGIGKIDRWFANSEITTQWQKYRQNIQVFGDIQRVEIALTNRSQDMIGWSYQGNYRFTKRTELSGSVRKEYYPGRSEVPLAVDLSLGNETKNKKGQLYLRIQQNFRQPTLNDLYWPQSGNPELEAETARTLYVGAAFNTKTQLKFELFAGQVNQLIQWTPNADDGLWQPINIGQVNRNGLNLEVSRRFDYRQIQYEMGLTHAYVTSQGEDQKQLIYTPKHQLKGFLEAKFKKGVSFNYAIQWASVSHVTRDHSASLPGFTVSNASVSKGFVLGNRTLKASVLVRNLFGYTYYIIPFRPMPGRYIGFKLEI